ncbi:MAG: glycosyltransferase N-terminal domain-containing protein, partial [Terriglobales bacterium]
MYFLYSLLLAVALALTAPWWLWAMLRHGKYCAGLSERLGRIPKRLIPRDVASCIEGGCATSTCIWVHAVSVGEVMGITGLTVELKRRLPDHRVVVSTTTATGQKLARERFGPENVFYFPLDFAFAVRPYLRALKPELLVIAETEFWPNLLRLANSSGTRIAVVNARISDRSFPGYRRFRLLMRPVLRGVGLLLAQSSEDVHRLIAIGAPAERVEVSGNLKFDVRMPPAAELVDNLRQKLKDAGA